MKGSLDTIFNMKREKLITNLLDFGYSKYSVEKLLQGKIKPVADKLYLLKDEYGIPVEAWRDIKKFIKNSNSSKAELSSGKK